MTDRQLIITIFIPLVLIALVINNNTKQLKKALANVKCEKVRIE